MRRPRRPPSTARRSRRCTRRRSSSAATTAVATTRSRASAWTAYQKENCTKTYGCVTELAAALLRRRPVARREVRPRQPVRRPGDRDLGARLRRQPAGAVRGHQGQVHRRHGSAGDHLQPRQQRRVLAERGRSPRCIRRPREGDGADPLRMARPAVHRRDRRRGDHRRRSRRVRRRTGSGTAEPPAGRCPDGVYRVTMWMADASNNRSAVGNLVTLDSAKPELTSATKPATISPERRPAVRRRGAER